MLDMSVTCPSTPLPRVQSTLPPPPETACITLLSTTFSHFLKSKLSPGCLVWQPVPGALGSSVSIQSPGVLAHLPLGSLEKAAGDELCKSLNVCRHLLLPSCLLDAGWGGEFQKSPEFWRGCSRLSFQCCWWDVACTLIPFLCTWPVTSLWKF